MMQPATKLVSVIVPVYNCEKYIKKCLTSILSQSYQQLEILVINDGSTDSSQKIIDNMAETDLRIQKLLQCNQGVAAARNHALSCATGDYYLFVDGDDYIGVDYIKDLVTCAEENQSELVICGYTLIYPHKGAKKVVPGVYVQNKQEEWAYRISAVCSRLYSSSFWKKNNLHFTQEPNSRAEDVPIALYSNAMAENICLISRSNYYYVQHENSAMHNKKKVAFLFPYIAFEEMYRNIQNMEIKNSRFFFNMGILKFLAQFDYVLYRNATFEEKKRFHIYIKNTLKDDLYQMQNEWKQKKKNVNFPLRHKLAISLFCKKMGLKRIKLFNYQTIEQQISRKKC